jgi:Zn finger protein HypA/HybF involved in hydrogenase expression
MKYTISQIITMYLDWMDEKPIGYDCDYNNEDLGEQFEKCFNQMEDSNQSNNNGCLNPHIKFKNPIGHWCATCKYMNECDVFNLLPCPFCGSNAEKLEREGIGDCDINKIYYDIRCTNEDCYLQDGADWNCNSYHKVVEMWNNRK